MNILWICTDQQRFDSLGCYGNGVIDTPNIDRLAKEGVQFDNCYSQSPVCSPSRGAFLTGRYPHTCGMRQNGASINPDEILVTKQFADAGYLCGLSGKLHLNPCHPSVCNSSEHRIDDGYSVFYWSHHPPRDWPLNDYAIWLQERGSFYQTRPYQGSHYIKEGMPEELHHTTYCTDRAVQFIRSAKNFQDNWLFSVNYFDPHHDFDPPKALMDKYMERLSQISLPNYEEGELDKKPVFQQIDHQGAYGGHAGHPYTEMSELDHKMHTAAYYAMVELVDKQVGLLLNTLSETGQAEDTLVVFTSDHGEMLGDHGIYLKGPYFYDCAVKVPLIIWMPKRIRQGLRVLALTELVDLPETLLEAAGLEPNPGMMGKSLWKICTGEQSPSYHRETVYSEYYNAMGWHQNPQAHCTMVFDGQYKIVVCHGINQGELYHLQTDPKERFNLWEDAQMQEIKVQMLLKLADRMAFTCDPLPERVAEW